MRPILQQGIDKDAYHIALEVKSTEKGDSDGKGSGAIEEAASQVCLSMNGMVELFAKKLDLFAREDQAVFLPIIFTTARVWVTNAELHKSDIETGKLPDNEFSIEERKYIFYQYHQSPGLMHSLGRPQVANNIDLSSWLVSDAIRTIPIVSANGIKEFLIGLSDDIHFLRDI